MMVFGLATAAYLGLLAVGAGVLSAVTARLRGPRRLTSGAVLALIGAEVGAMYWSLGRTEPAGSLDMASDPMNTHPWTVPTVDPHVIAREAIDPAGLASHGRPRVVVLGDSFAAGNGVGRAKSFPSKLRQLRPDLDVINLSVPAAGTCDEAVIHEAWGRQFKPDIVMVAVVLNDIGGSRPATAFIGGEVQDLFERTQTRPRAPFLLTQVATAVAMRDATARVERQYTAQWADPIANARFASCLGRIRASTPAGASLWIVALPLLHRLDDYPFTQAHEVIRTHAHDLGAQFIDLLPDFVGLSTEETWAAVLDHHPNERSHQRIAERLAATLPTIRGASASAPSRDASSLLDAIRRIPGDPAVGRGCGAIEPSTALLAEAFVALAEPQERSAAVATIESELRDRERPCPTR